MKDIGKYIVFAWILLIAGACSDPYNDELDTSGLNLQPNTPEETELDRWLFENFTAPYNIEVKYRWDGTELDIDKTLVPPVTGKVQSIMNIVRDAWIDPYTEEAGSTFLKTYCPKQFVLVGSGEYNPGGTVTLGTAEGGRKIVLYVINQFEETDRRKIKEQMHTVHHEFAHILHQSILYPAAFKTVTAGGYSADWYNSTHYQAQRRGFITNYAMSAPDEDFVEMIALMLIEGKRGFDRIVCAIDDSRAQALIRQKEQFVVNYFSDVYDVDIYKLQQRTDEAIDAYAPKTFLADFGLNQSQMFTSIRIDPDKLPPLPADFQNIYDQTSQGIETITDAPLDSIDLFFRGDGYMYLDFLFTLDGETTSSIARILYSMTTSPDGSVTFEFVAQNGNASFIKNGLQPMVDYFENNAFKFEWIPNEEGGCIKDLGGINPNGLPHSYRAFGKPTNHYVF